MIEYKKSKVKNIILSLLVTSGVGASAYAAPALPDGSQGPAGAKLSVDLLSGGGYGKFQPIEMPKGAVNDEKEAYKKESVSIGNNNAINITAKMDGWGNITSGRLNTQNKWSTADNQLQDHGYIEVRALLPAAPNTHEYRGAWPAIWMLPSKYGDWPHHGEIDIMEMVNGIPSSVMSLHSTNHNGGGAQHPTSPYQLDTDLTKTPGIFGLEWNLHGNQIDLTWWTTYYSNASHSWVHKHATKVLNGNNDDYNDFYNTFKNGGYDLIVNLAEGGNWPENVNTDWSGPKIALTKDKPQHMTIISAKAYSVS